MTTSISIASIDVGDRLRALDPTWVALLAEEIGAEGLVEPIQVTPHGDGYKLISGARRIAAVISLGWDEIDAIVDVAPTPMSEADIRLAEIKSHLLRGELTALDRAVVVSAWCDLYKAANGTKKPGPKPKLSVIEGGSDEALEELAVTMTVNWSDAAQAALQISEKTLFRHLKIAQIGADLRARIALHVIARSQKDLLLLAAQTPVRQKALVDILTAKGSQIETVAAAIAQFDRTPQPIRIDPITKFVDRFSGLDQKDQFAFFDRQADLIEAWAARRSKKKAA